MKNILKEKKNFEKPSAIIIEFGIEDIILTSGEGGEKYEFPGGDDFHLG